MSGDDLDRAIDDAVREIMGAEPPAGLRQRVLQRLSRPERPVWLAIPRLAAAGVVMLCLAAGAWVVLTTTRNERSEHVDVASAPRPPQRSSLPALAPSVTRSPHQSIAPRPDRHSPPVASNRADGGQAERIVTATSLVEPESTVSISPLDPLRKIDPEPVKSEVVEMDAIAIAPLQQLEPVRIEPLSSMPR